MIWGFETDDIALAAACQVIYVVYRSRDHKRFKVTPDMWGRIEQAAKSAAKRAADLTDFIEKLKPKLCCRTLRRQWMTADTRTVTLYKAPDGTLLSRGVDRVGCDFLVDVLSGRAAPHASVLDNLYRKTSLVIALVRERLERERPLEAELAKEDEDGESERAEA